MLVKTIAQVVISSEDRKEGRSVHSILNAPRRTALRSARVRAASSGTCASVKYSFIPDYEAPQWRRGDCARYGRNAIPPSIGGAGLAGYSQRLSSSKEHEHPEEQNKPSLKGQLAPSNTWDQQINAEQGTNHKYHLQNVFLHPGCSR